MKFYEVIIFSFVHKVRTIETKAFAKKADAKECFRKEVNKAVVRVKECKGDDFAIDDEEDYFSAYDDTCQDFEISVSMGEKTMA